MNLHQLQNWLLTLVSLFHIAQSAPTSRQTKSLRDQPIDGLYDYYFQNDYPDPNPPTQYLQSDPLPYDELDENEVLGRGAFNRRHNSPIYYIRLPPAPYMFVPGLGYVSHPPSVAPLGPTPNSFINLPINFVSNGKPSNIYQWSAAGAESPFKKPTPTTTTTTTTTTTRRPPTHSRPDSTIHRLPGKFPFNGKPTDIKILRDSYNSLYADALQNFYP